MSNLLGRHYVSYFYVHDISLHKLKNGLPFDASSIELCSSTEISDFYMKIDHTSCWIEEIEGKNTVNVLCDIKTFSRNDYFKCPRTILKKACEFVKKNGLVDTIYFGNEIEFFVFDKINFCMDEYNMYLKIYDRESLVCKNNSEKGIHDVSLISYKQMNTDDSGQISCNNTTITNNSVLASTPKSSVTFNRGFDKFYFNTCTDDDSKKINKKTGYFACPPKNSCTLLNYKMCRVLNELNILVQRHHHEVSVGQHEISLKYFDAIKNADNIYIAKYIIKNVVHQFNRTATFMPKPFTCDNGSGLHCNISLWKDNKNIFYSDNPSTFFLSKECFYFMNGLLKHGKALQAFCNSTMNSYKRLVPGFETSQKLYYSFGSRNAAIRIPLIDYNKPYHKRIEFRLPDMANSPHLIFAAIILAGFDGLKCKEQPLPPFEHKMGKYFIPDIFAKYVENISEFEPLNNTFKDYCNFYDLKEAKEYENFFRSETPKDTSASLKESLDALEKDHAFLTVENIFSKEMIHEYIQYKRQEISAYNKQVTVNDYALYFNS